MAVPLRKVKCIHGLWGRYDCGHCIQEGVDLMEWQRDIDEAAATARLVIPATDREWQEYLETCGHGEPSEVMA